MRQIFRVRALENLTKELKRRSDREGKNYILIDQANLLLDELLEISFDQTQVGQELETFEMSGKSKLSGIVFDQTALAEILAKKIQSTQDHRKKLLKIDPDSIEFRVLESEEFENKKWIKVSVNAFGVETLDLKAQNQFAQKWQQNLKKEIAGKTLISVRGILTNHPEIDEVHKIHLRPFWSNTIPRLLNQIELEVVD